MFQSWVNFYTFFRNVTINRKVKKNIEKLINNAPKTLKLPKMSKTTKNEKKEMPPKMFDVRIVCI